MASQTVRNYKKWKAAKVGLFIGKYASVCVPATVITIVNWEEWFAKAGPSLPFGFASLLISIIVTILAIVKGDELVNKNISKIYYIAIIMAIWAISFMFLANILQQMGQMLLWTIIGILGSATCDQVTMKVVNPTIEEYKGLIEECCLDTTSKKKAERKKLAEAEAPKRQATE